MFSGLTIEQNEARYSGHFPLAFHFFAVEDDRLVKRHEQAVGELESLPSLVGPCIASGSQYQHRSSREHHQAQNLVEQPVGLRG